MKIKALQFSILFLIWPFFSGYAQEEIKGQVLDLELRTPVVFATIQFKQSKNGFVTDESGYFRLPESYKNRRDTLVISSIGFITKKIPIITLEDDEINTIFLKPKVESLDEVTVIGNKKKKQSWVSGVSLVKKAIANISVNYPITPHSYIGYYRDYQLVKNEYLNLNEAIIEVFDAGIHTNKLNDKYNQTALYEYNSNVDFPRDKAMTEVYNSDVKYIKNASISAMGGNELSILNIHDPIRNHDQFSFSFIDVFRRNFIGNHEFKVLRTTYLNDTPIYEIEFKDIKPPAGTINSVIGKIYIVKDNFAIHKLEYKVFKQHKDQPLYSLKLEYARKGEHMYLNYISFNNIFQIRDRKEFKVKSLTLDTNKNAFILTFTNPVHEKAITNLKNFRFLYKRKKLSINAISFLAPNILQISLVSGTIQNIETLSDEAMENVTYRIKNITDIGNRKLNKGGNIKVNQFRELFVQEVYPNRSLPLDVVFMRKKEPLLNSSINLSLKNEKYWINTPLKKYRE